MNLGLDANLTHTLHHDDPDRFWCLVPAEPGQRPAAAALLAFNQELGRIPQQVTQPMAGFIRLEWWREAIAEARAGRPRHHPVAGVLPLIQAAGLGDASLVAMVDARERELDERPMADLGELLAHARATAGLLQESLAAVAGGDPVRARRIGTGYGLMGILRATGHLAARGQILLPDDLLRRHGVGRDALLAGKPGPGLAEVAAMVALAARDELRGLRPLRGEPATPLLLITRHQLRMLDRLDHDPFAAATIGRPPLLALRLLVLQGLRV
ncbi:phytoene/squalene synthase family protein [Geminicoccus flavidas]|uniref:phytoene/squalene synthase family protein n=1 Tax=Geminicoccus flavidas TaxID=2506407 RepID=UPI00135723BB|nr:squalene/phytoene synthase family protein [Geminicoccus flavidas]